MGTVVAETVAIVAFWFFFMFRVGRILGNCLGALFYRPWEIPFRRTVSNHDCSVVIPIYGRVNPGLEACIRTILLNCPDSVYLVTVGHGRREILNNFVGRLRSEFTNTNIHVGAIPFSNKRHQLAHAIPEIQTGITILADDHVIWPYNFLASALAPFEDPRVGGVGTNKRIRRHCLGLSWESFRCFLADVYHEAINFENRAVNFIDGSMSVISGETALYRTEILQDRAFLEAFQNERLFYKYGPFKAGDDNFITRWLVQHGWELAYQDTGDHCISVSLPSNARFIHHCERRARNKWRSSLKALSLPQMWKKYPWGLFAIHISGLYDATLIIIFAFTPYAKEVPGLFGALIFLLLISKLIKAMPVFYRTPKDLLFIPAFWVVGYFHTFLKMKALFEITDTRWTPGSPLRTEEAMLESQHSWHWGYQQELRSWSI